MKLPTRQTKKRNQALDAFASLAKTWSEWRLGERAAQSVATGTKKASKAAAKARKRAGKSDSRIKAALKSTPVRIAGAAALVGGVGAAVAKKLKGGGTAEPLYTPPPAPAPMDPPAALEDVPAPSTGIVIGDLDASDSAVASSEKAVAAASQSAGAADGDSATGASEQAVTDATPEPPSGTEPTVPDTDPEPAADTTDDDEVEDAMDAHSDSEADAETEPATTAAADPEELEAAPAGDGHDDDAPTLPGDDAKS